MYAICQSDDGYLWIGTERGLVRFDGFNFSLIQDPISGLPPIGAVRGLVADGEGNLWIRLDGPQLLLYRDGKFQNAFSRFALQESAFTSMAEDSQRGLLLAGISGKIYRFRSGAFHTLVDLHTSSVISLAETADHRIWLGTQSSGLLCLDQQSLSNTPKEFFGKSVNTILPAYIGGVWVGLDSGIERWHHNELAKLQLRPATGPFQTLAVTRDRDANLWVGSNRGLIRITPAGSAAIWAGDPNVSKVVTAVFEDRDKNLWFGGPDGLERLQDGFFETYSSGEGLPNENAGPIFTDEEGKTWFAPLSGGLYWLKGGRIEHVAVDGLDKDVIYSITGGSGEIWVGRQHGGLTVLKQEGGSLFVRTYTRADGLPQDSIYSVYRARDGSLWAGSVSGGVSRFKDSTFSRYSIVDGLVSDTINSIVEGADGTMWFGTPDGLSSFKKGQWTNRSAQDGLPSGNILSVFEDSRQILWIGTSAGLAFLASGQVRILHNVPEPFHEQIFGIAEDSRGDLWVATSDHILQVNLDRLLSGSLRESDLHSFGVSDGLKGSEGVRRDRSLITDQTGRVWVSTVKGLAVAHPRLIHGYVAPVSARIESMSVEGSPVDITLAPELPAGSRSITINYASSILARPDRVRFRYKLDGSGQDWSATVASRQVIYTNLGPGSYSFHILASDGDDLWNGPETVLSFVIKPRYWQTWWFESLCLVAFGIAILMFYRLRMYQVTRQLNLRFQERLAERSRIAQELHDTLLQGVLSASLQLDVAEDQLPDDSPAKPKLQKILRLMGKVTEEGRSALRGLRAPEIDNHSLEMAFSRVRQEFSFDDSVDFRVIVNGVPARLRPVIRDEAYRIGREAIVNAFVHARARSVEVEIEYSESHLRVLVRDDGVGVDPRVLDTGREGHWGLSGMRDRAQSIGARLRLRSRMGAGTEVELVVPNGLAFECSPRKRGFPGLSWLPMGPFRSATGKQRK